MPLEKVQYFATQIHTPVPCLVQEAIMSLEINRRRAIFSIVGTALLAHPLGSRLLAAVQVQPLAAQVRRLVEAMAYLGEPLPDMDRKQLEAAANLSEEARAVAEIQRVLDPRCL